VLDRPALAAQLGMLERDAAADNLWDNPAEAQALLKELNRLKEGVAAADGFTALLDDARAALDMAEQEARSQMSHPSHKRGWQCMQQHCMQAVCCEVFQLWRDALLSVSLQRCVVASLRVAGKVESACSACRALRWRRSLGCGEELVLTERDRPSVL